MNRLFNEFKMKFIQLKEKGAFHIIAGSFLTKFAAFFGSVFLVRLLSKSDYGVLGYYENFTGYFTIFAGLGFASGILRHMVLAKGAIGKKNCFLYALRYGNIWNIFLVALCVVLCLFYPHPQAFRGYRTVALMLTLSIPFAFSLKLSLVSLRSLFDYKGYAYLAFGTSTFLIVARVLGAAVGGLNATAEARFFAEIVAAIVCILFLFSKFFSGIDGPPLEDEFCCDFRNYSLQIMMTDGLWAIFMLNDMFLLGQLCGSEVLIADYKIACVIPANLSIFVSSVGVFVAPYFTKYEDKGDYSWVRKKMLLVVAVTSAIMGFLSIVFFFLADPLVCLLYGKKYLTAVPIMRVLLISTFFNYGICSSFANVLSAMGVQKLNLFVAAIGMMVQIILDVYLIPKFGAIGVACSNAVVYIVMSVALMTIFYKKYCS